MNHTIIVSPLSRARSLSLSLSRSLSLSLARALSLFLSLWTPRTGSVLAGPRLLRSCATARHVRGGGGRLAPAQMAAAHNLWLVCLQMRVNRTPGRKSRTASLTALVVLVAASLVGSAQARYSCTSDSQCQYPTCNDNPCSSSDSLCINGKWKAYCWDGECVSGNEPHKRAFTTLTPAWA
jgi:hypothetical protein